MDSWEEIKAAVKQQSDIVQIVGEHVDLKRSGVRYLGLCPFHQEKTPSFSVHPGQQFYYCFGCGAAGDVFNFVMEYNHVEFREALKVLADRLHISLPQQQQSDWEIEQQRQRQALFAVSDKAARLYHRFLLQAPEAQSARRYLQQRGIGPAVIERYRLGYAPSIEDAGWNFFGNQLDQAEREAAVEAGLLVTKEQGRVYDRFRDRIMCPICDSRGRVAGFGGRILGDGNPKYLNSPESRIYHKSNLLFGLFQQLDEIRKQRRVTVVEGNFDLLSLVNHGYQTVVAPLGTALTKEQLRLLKGMVDEAVLLFDGDSAGSKAAERAVPLFLAERISAKVALLPTGEDPDSFIRKHGREELEKVVAQAEPLPEFALNCMIRRHGMSLDGKTRIVEELQPLLAAADSTLQRSVMAAHFAGVLGIDTEQLQRSLAMPGRVGAESSRQPPAVSKREQTAQLSGGLRDLISFMVFHPQRLPELVNAGAEELVAGSIGEIILIQLQQLRAARGDGLQPEELLSALPEGEERSLVASLLSGGDTSKRFMMVASEKGEDSLGDVMQWVRRCILKKRSDDLMNSIIEAEKTNDIGTIIKLQREKVVVDTELKAL